jgi:hypothetical protein
MTQRLKAAVPRRPDLIHTFLDEIEWSVTKKYVELLRGRGELLSIGDVDVDVPQIVRRHFLCDAQRCIEWVEGRPLVDRSCCCRYDVPLTARDREVVLRHLDEVRAELPVEARLLDPTAEPFEPDEDYGWEMVHDNPLGGCQFNLYRDGRCRCALHLAALEQRANPHDYKPLACSLWPLAVSNYDEDRGERLLLTIYCPETQHLFDGTDDEPFACIVDQDARYPRLYQAERSTLEHIFGAAWWRKLDGAARQILSL